MLNITETAIRLYRQIFGTPEFAGQLADGIETVLDGNTAIAVTEACITEVAALGGGFLEQGAALAWLSEQQRVSTNLFGEKLSVQQADSPRGALASAIGVTLSGHRSTVFLSAQELSGCQDILQTAVGRRLPLVIHLDNRLSAMQANSTGSGHDAVHHAMDSGCFVLFASNVQEAVDFTLIARHVAEITLTPALVVVDGAETALAIQNVCLPSAELVKQFIGRADEMIESPSAAQKQLFSEQRSRIHSWHDLDKPVLQGAMQDPEIYALGSAARKIYFEELINETLENAFTQFAKLTSRQYSTVSGYGLNNADVIVVAQGSAVEIVRTLSDSLKYSKLKGAEKINLGVIGLHSLRPFDAAKLLELLSSKKSKSSRKIVILERMEVPLADDSPLTREIRAAIQHKFELQDSSVKSANLAKLHSIIYGLGGAQLNIADLWQLCREIKQDDFSARYLGVSFLSDTKQLHPKRQVMLDTLKRYYPQINTLAINAKEKQISLSADAKNKVLSFAISHLRDSDANISYATELSAYLHKLTDNYIRSSLSASWEQWAQRQTDYVIQSEQPYETGSSSRVDYFVALSVDDKSLLSACQSLNTNGVLIFSENLCSNNKDSHNAVIADCIKLIKDKSLTLYHLDVSEQQQTAHISLNEQQWEKSLAILMAVLQNNDKLNIKSRKFVSTRHSLLTHVSEDKQNQLGDIFKETLTAVLDNDKSFAAHSLLLSRLQDDKTSDYSDPGRNSTAISDVPEMVKNLAQVSETYDSLPRFWDQVGVLHQNGETDQLTVDPYLATGTIPSLSATFNPVGQYRSAFKDNDIPSFNSQECTACGLCWSNCPESAIATVALSPKALIETGIKITGTDAVRQVTSKLASRIAKRCRNNEVDAVNAGQILEDSFDWLKEKSGLPVERLQNIEADFEKLHPAIADLPIVTSDLLFYSQEKKQNDSGELFSLIINPDTCKGCGLCVELCGAQNIESEQEPALTISQVPVLNDNQSYQLKQQWKIWQQTPDTSSDTIERIIKDQSMDTGAALMLSRHNAFSLSGGDLAEQASGEKIAMRHLLSATEYHQQPLLHQFVSELQQLRDELKQEINTILSEALPTDNLAQLSDKLSDVKTRQVDLNSLLRETSQVMDNSAIDAVKTNQLVKLVMQINELHWKLTEGTYGIGRSRYSLCITSSSIASWAGTFPHNPFHVPVNIDVSGESAQVAAGLVQGQINDLLSAVSLMRQARAVIDPRYAKNTERLENLDWQDLTDEEKQLCPPLLLVGGDDLLGTHGFSQVSLLLNSSFPVKVVIFSELDSGLVFDGLHEYKLNRRSDSRNNLAMMAMSQRNAYVAQTSIADNSHFQQSVHELLGSNSAGLLCIHTPSPSRHGFAPEHTLRQAELAVKSRMFPLFRYKPDEEGVFGTRLSLEGNEDPLLAWQLDEEDQPINPIHWAINEKRFQAHFSALTSNAAFPTELSQWLTMNASEQEKKTPFISLLADGEGENKVAISKEFSSMIVNQQNAWQTLQELAGIVTPFTEHVEQVVQERLSSEHQADLDALRSEYEAKIAQINENYQNETHTKIRNQLLGLAGYDADKLRKH